MKLVARIVHLFKKTRSHHVHHVYDEWSWHTDSPSEIHMSYVLQCNNLYLFKIHSLKIRDGGICVFIAAFIYSSRIFEYMCIHYSDMASECRSFLDVASFSKKTDDNMRIYNKYFLES